MIVFFNSFGNTGKSFDFKIEEGIRQYLVIVFVFDFSVEDFRHDEQSLPEANFLMNLSWFIIA